MWLATECSKCDFPRPEARINLAWVTRDGERRGVGEIVRGPDHEVLELFINIDP
jgi:hypothetical protein